MTIYLGADHRGFDFKKKIYQYLTAKSFQVIDVGDKELNPDDDFPKFASLVANNLLADFDHNSRGILVCGSGQGMIMAANRFKGIRASLCLNVAQSRAARNEDDANVLCLSADQTTIDEAKNIIDVWLSTPFAAAPRYVRRLQELDQLT